MASCPITFWEIETEEMETVKDFIFRGSKITADSECICEIKICFLLGRIAMTNLDIALAKTTVSFINQLGSFAPSTLINLLILYEFQSRIISLS